MVRGIVWAALSAALVGGSGAKPGSGKPGSVEEAGHRVAGTRSGAGGQQVEGEALGAGAHWSAEADRLGVTEAVAASQLPMRSQRRLAAAIVRESQAHGLDPLLVVAVIRAESSFNAYAESPVGALGLMQVMPDTGAWLLSRRGERLGRAQHLFDPELNVELGVSYLAELKQRFGTLDKALVAYNAGPSAARRILSGPDRGQRFLAGYPKKVLSDYRRLSQAHASSKRLASSGGLHVPARRGQP